MNHHSCLTLLSGTFNPTIANKLVYTGTRNWCECERQQCDEEEETEAGQMDRYSPRGRWDFNHLLRETVLNPISQSDKLGDERTFNQSIDKGAALKAESFTLLFIIVTAVSTVCCL